MKNLELNDAVAVVTGGNGGIGLGIAKGLAEAGARVVISGRNETKNQQALAELQASQPECHAVRCDVRDKKAITALFDETRARYGPVEILVNNAGVAIGVAPESITDEDWDTVLDTNLKSVFWCCQAAFDDLKQQSGRGRAGKIINIGSMYSIFGGARVASYGASKGGVVQLTKALAAAWGAYDIQVNAILPGWIATDMTVAVQEDTAFSDSIIERTPAARFGEPDDLSGAAVFLASKAANFVTGVALPVDGGYSVG